jgi:hypothetical protein
METSAGREEKNMQRAKWNEEKTFLIIIIIIMFTFNPEAL